jgi:tetratricopeptide (TPR) repeat protein
MSAGDALGWVPQELAREYRLEQILSEANGLVRVLAHDRRLDRPVLLVMLSPACAKDDWPAERFLASMRLLARVRHAGVRAVHRADAYGDFPFAVLEHVPGPQLAGELVRGPVPRKEATGYGLELLDALAESHAQGVAHPDLSPAAVIRHDGRLVIDGVGAVPADRDSERAGLERVARIVYLGLAGRNWDPAQPGATAFRGVPLRLRPVLRRALAPNPDARWPDAASFRRALALTRTRRRAAAAALLLVGALAAVAGAKLARPSAPPSNELALLPLDGGADSLRPDLSYLLGLTLKDVPGLALTSPRRVERWAAGHGREVEGIQHLAPRELGVRWAAHGLVARSGDSLLRVRLTLYPWRGTKVSLPEITESVRNLPRLSERLSLSILETVAPELEPRIGGLQDFAGVGFEAIKAFLQGEAAFDRDAWTSAREHYEAAIRADSAFALARWRLANVRRWERKPYDFFGDIRRLDQRYGARLRPTDRATVEALLEPDVERRIQRLDSLVSQSRPDAYLQYLYAEELFHRGPLRGHDIDLAARAMARTIELDSSFAEAYNHLFAVHLRAGRRAAARRILDLRRRIAVDAWAGDLDKVRLMELAYDERFVPWLGRLKLRWLEHASDSTLLAGAAQVARLGAPWFDIPATQVSLCRILLARGSPEDSMRAGARNGMAVGLFALGRPAEAAAQLDSSTAAWSSVEARLQRAEWAVMPALAGLPPATDVSWRALIESLSPDTAPGAFTPRIRWVLAAGSLGAGDTAGFVAQVDTLEALAPGSPLAVLLRAVAAGVGGRPALAITISDSVRGVMSVNQPPDPFAGALYHLLRADWRMALGDHRAADREWRWVDGSDFDGWPVGAVQPGEIDAAFGVYARWRRGDAALSSAATPRDSAAACAMLRRAAELWSSSEPAMHPLRDAATRRARTCPR